MKRQQQAVSPNRCSPLRGVLKHHATIDVNLRTLSHTLGSGALSSAHRLSSAVLMVSAGDHSFFRMSRQMAPVCELTFGCHSLVVNCAHKQTTALDSVRAKAPGALCCSAIPLR